jgi:hypothetical protein
LKSKEYGTGIPLHPGFANFLVGYNRNPFIYDMEWGIEKDHSRLFMNDGPNLGIGKEKKRTWMNSLAVP